MILAANRQRVRPAGIPSTLPAACALLATFMAPAGALAGWQAYMHNSTTGLQAALLAAITCWLSATAALVLAGLMRGTPQAISGILGGTAVRLAGPLLVTAACAATRSPLSAAGLFGYMVVFFLYSLTIETVLLIGLVRSAAMSQASPSMPKEGR